MYNTFHCPSKKYVFVVEKYEKWFKFSKIMTRSCGIFRADGRVQIISPSQTEQSKAELGRST